MVGLAEGHAGTLEYVAPYGDPDGLCTVRRDSYSSFEAAPTPATYSVWRARPVSRCIFFANWNGDYVAVHPQNPAGP
jgi:hypothetical protein